MKSGNGGLSRFARKKAPAPASPSGASSSSKQTTANDGAENQKAPNNDLPLSKHTNNDDADSQVFEGSFHSSFAIEDEEALPFAFARGASFDVEPPTDIQYVQVPELPPTNDAFGGSNGNNLVHPNDSTVGMREAPFKGRSLKNDDINFSGGKDENMVRGGNGGKPPIPDKTTFATTTGNLDVSSEYPQVTAPVAVNAHHAASGISLFASKTSRSQQELQEPESLATANEQVDTLHHTGAHKDRHLETVLDATNFYGNDVPIESTRKSVDTSGVFPEKGATGPEGTAPTDTQKNTVPQSKTPNDSMNGFENMHIVPPPSLQDPVVTPVPKTGAVWPESSYAEETPHEEVPPSKTPNNAAPQVSDDQNSGMVVTPELEALVSTYNNRITNGGKQDFSEAHGSFIEHLRDQMELVERGEIDLINLQVQLAYADSLLLQFTAELRDLLEELDEIDAKGKKVIKEYGMRG